MKQDATRFAGPVSTADGLVPPPVNQRVFLMLQGPHGPFFDRLGALLRAAGAQVWRVGFNAGDEYFWSDKKSFIRHEGTLHDWPPHLDRILTEKGVTDIVLYGDVRPIHGVARAAAEEDGIRLHVFEEGYLRPYWISYERGGSNGHSPLMRISLGDMRAALRDSVGEVKRPPARWGDMRQHKFYGALYHFLVMVRNRAYRNYRGHRDIGVGEEFRLNLKRLLMMPVYDLQRRRRWRQVRRSGAPYSLVLMQLQHDSNFQGHSRFHSNAQFIKLVMAEFAAAAPKHHHLVFKSHPLEDGRSQNLSTIRELAREFGLRGRVHYLRGGRLASMMALAKSIVTVNSTGAQQALWRSIPVKVLGRAIYEKPGIVSPQSLADFFADPQPPDPAAYKVLRDFLLQTSQIPGGYYSERSRSHALRIVSDLILESEDTYGLLASGRSGIRQQVTDSF